MCSAQPEVNMVFEFGHLGSRVLVPITLSVEGTVLLPAVDVAGGGSTADVAGGFSTLQVQSSPVAPHCYTAPALHFMVIRLDLV